MWPHMVLLFFTAMAMCVPIQLSMALCDLVWSYMAFYGKISSFLAVIDPNSFGLVKVKRSIAQWSEGVRKHVYEICKSCKKALHQTRLNVLNVFCCTLLKNGYKCKTLFSRFTFVKIEMSKDIKVSSLSSCL